MQWISVVPLIVVLVLLFRRQHMLVAGFAGGLLALIIAALFGPSLPVIQETVQGNPVDVRLTIPRAFQQFTSSIVAMLGFTSPIVNAAAAAMVAGAGGYAASLELARRGLRGRVELLAPFVVLMQAFATYTAGNGAGNTVITAPLIAAALGAPRAVIAGMAVATAGAFTTSPSSAESALVSRLSGFADTGPYVEVMRPFFLLTVVAGMAIAWWGVRRQADPLEAAPAASAVVATTERATITGRMDDRDEAVRAADDRAAVTSRTDDREAARTRSDDPDAAPARQVFTLDPHASTADLWRMTIPAIWLLGAVILARPINDLLRSAGFPMVMSPLFYVGVTVALVVLVARRSLEATVEGFVQGASFILVRLFAVGVFLGFINMIQDIGAFKLLSEAALSVPSAVVVPVAAIVGFLIAIPAGAYSVAVMGLLGPALAAAGFSPLQLGFVMMVIGMGTQISWVQINVAALSYGFNITIPQVVRNNLPAVVPVAIVLTVLSLIFGR